MVNITIKCKNAKSINTNDYTEIIEVIDDNNIIINTDELDDIFIYNRKKISKKVKKNILTILYNCYNNIVSEYFNNISEQLYNVKVNNIDILEWMLRRENDINISIGFTDKTLCLTDTYIIFNNQTVTKNVSKKNITFKGGMIIDTTQISWINHIINYLIHKKQKTIIICIQKCVRELKLKCTIPDVHIYDIKLVLSDLLDTYKITTTKWDRLLIDNQCYEEMLNNEQFKKKIIGIKATYRWVCLKDLSYIRNEIETYFQHLSGVDNLELPIYGNITINELIIKISNNAVLLNLEHKLAVIKKDYIESSINNHYQDISFNIKATTLLNRLIYNALINKLPTDDCPICYENLNYDNCIGVKCKHYFCIQCCLKIIDTSNKCPLCRSKIDNRFLFRIKENDTITGSKYKQLIGLLNGSNKAIIYTANSFMFTYIKNIIDNAGYDSYITNRDKNKVIDEFNKTTKGVLILKLDDFIFIDTIHSIDTIIFIDTNRSTLEMTSNFKISTMDNKNINQVIKVYTLIYQ